MIELLVVIAILAVLTVAVVLILNPAELLKEGRDSTRLSDLATLNKAVALYLAGTLNSPLWTTAIIGTADCTPGNCNTPDILSTSTAVDGTGWVDINFGIITAGSPISRLPMDPNNNGVCPGGQYSPDGGYNGARYTCGYYLIQDAHQYKFETRMESVKFYVNPATEVVTKDGGLYPNVYEIGNDMSFAD